MEHSPIEEAICDITVSEFVPNTINPTLPPMRLERKIITVDVEGYNWVSRRCAYYKSSGMSNASTDDNDKILIRKYMWFPILGLVQENSLIDSMFKSIKSEKKPGYFIKNIRVDLGDLYNGNLNSLTKFESRILDATFNSYDNRFFDPTYLVFLREIMQGTNVSKEVFDEEINNFNKFIAVMSQYCYNWKQVQYSVRLSYNNIVDTVPLSSSIFNNACLFILNYDLQDEFSAISSLWVKVETPLTPIRITFSETMQTIEDPILINNLLLRKLAVNEELIIIPQNPTISTEEIKTKLYPFRRTVILGTPFTNTVTVSTHTAVATETSQVDNLLGNQEANLQGNQLLTETAIQPQRTPNKVVKASKNKRPGSKKGGKNKISKSKKYKNKNKKTHKKRKSVKNRHK
jgi:hypothetical protein